MGQTGPFLLFFLFFLPAISPSTLRIAPDLKQQELSEHRLSRLKRQAYAVHEGNSEIALSVDSRHKESGPWGGWNVENECSRTCGGGVQKEIRTCNGRKCVGSSTRYVSCNIDACPEGSPDFRTEQCEAQNDVAVEGKYYSWKPAVHGLGIKSKCELNCQPIGARFFMFFGMVKDGTKCDAFSNDICVEGLCLPLGCDGKLGSPKKEDKCLECDGNAQNCKTVDGYFDERNLKIQSYHDIVTIPEGAMSIQVQERRATNNYLAIRNESDHWYLNGNLRIEMSQTLPIAGTVFDYERKKEGNSAFEKLTARGPLTEDLIISILYQSDTSTGILYEYSLPLEEVKYVYKPSAEGWSECSVTCGKGMKTRSVDCVDQSAGGRVVDAELCEENNASKPETEKVCNTVDCEAEWFAGEWEECSSSCGDLGWQYRVIYCHQVFRDGKKITVDDAECGAERPAYSQTCNRFTCPDWNAGPWSSCSKKCGEASQYRSVTCRSEKPEDEGKLLPASACPVGTDPVNKRSCNLGPCEGLHFETTEWDLCAKCNDTTETRTVTCEGSDGQKFPLEKCEEDGEERPSDERPCEKVVPCDYQWQSSEWSDCSTDCGHGHKARNVVCAIQEPSGDLNVVDDFHCEDVERPGNSKNCTKETACTGKFMAELWSECSKTCGGGVQTRKVHCFTWDFKVNPRMCDDLDKPPTEQECNIEPCPVCVDSEFGCCPDNSTFADGPFLEGCSNCSISEFGCCADNYTEASGPDSIGCPEYVEGSGDGDSSSSSSSSEESSSDCADTEYGCCIDGVSPASEDGMCPEAQCEYTDTKSSEVFTISCVNDTDVGNETMGFGNETETIVNETKTCAKSEFGCCPDWVTFAEGKDMEGCPEFIMGECNGTLFGCCQDNVTLARGPDLQGCGLAGCSASVFGCCQDRRTIAFGPHYMDTVTPGCERSSFPCEASEFGCCPDGKTAALGRKGEGCGESCLFTKFGCCPDGMTAAEGANNKGCGCRYAQYGCCPDGKTPADGANFRGCPESCAQSHYGCCPDGKTKALGPNREGCPCEFTTYGCCNDGESAAQGPNKQGCDDCRNTKYRCCQDGVTAALGPNYLGCPTTTPIPAIAGGTVSPVKLAACSLPKSAGNLCGEYILKWHYDTESQRCTQFWYSQCGGNDNRFDSENECETVCVNPPEQGVCYLAKMEGSKDCSKYTIKYYYDVGKQRCSAFYWSGCGIGNGNRFETLDDCQRKCANVGAPPVVVTVTPIPVPVQTTQAPRTQPRPRRPCQPNPCRQGTTCREEWERCDSGENGWCLVARCPDEETTTTTRSQRSRLSESECRLPWDSGNCKAYIERWYFDSYTGRCNKAIYGGCEGNQNRFEAEHECRQQCGHYGPKQTFNFPPGRGGIVIAQQRSCDEPMVRGTCEGAFTRYYFEKAMGKCLSFHYTGCGGNRNNFNNLAQCERECVAKPSEDLRESSVPAQSRPNRGQEGLPSICRLPKEHGQCDTLEAKWYYRAEDGVCMQFFFSGCNGNENRFDTEEECVGRCRDKSNPCELPKVEGKCRAMIPRWFFNKERGECVQFTYGGCLGNSNNFLSLKECQGRCVPNAGRTVLAVSVGLEQSPRQQAMREADKVDVNVIRDEEYEVEAEEISNLIPPLSKDEVCSLPMDSGPCDAQEEAWYYDIVGQECIQFTFGGCEGNLNRFSSKSECRKTCQGYKVGAGGFEKPVAGVEPEINEIPERRISNPRQYPGPSSLLPELCKLQMEAGDCFGENLRWYYDSESEECRGFMFTGCKGNANRFTSEEACLRACGRFRDQDVCTLGYDEGECDRTVQKWHYNPSSGFCENFLYGGCGGNGNRFSSKEECQNLCASESGPPAATMEPSVVSEGVCLIERDPGPCTDAVSQWYFDQSEAECKLFTYGGCRGNGNRFGTKEECEIRCKGEERLAALARNRNATICSLPFEVGHCRAHFPRYYYNAENKQCEEFVYGGCGGNQNNFLAINECEAACGEGGTRADVSISSEQTTYRRGMTITLLCESRGKKQLSAFFWFKGGARVDAEADRIVISGPTLVIRESKVEDSGDYACAPARSRASTFSNPISIVVKEEESLVAEKASLKTCEDQSDKADCSLILKGGLCSHKYYSQLCCRTCWKAH